MTRGQFVSHCALSASSERQSARHPDSEGHRREGRPTDAKALAQRGAHRRIIVAAR
jgi:hypothetical protein